MSSCLVQSYEDSEIARIALAEFLERTFREAGNASVWLRRFENWWDLNPFDDSPSVRGWVLKSRDTDELVGFLGLIPVCYAVDGVKAPAVVPTTWVVDPRYREASMMLGRRLQELEGQTLIVSTTGRRDFQERLERRGWVLNREAVRQFVPCGWLAKWVVGGCPDFSGGRRMTSEVDEVRSVAGCCQSGKGIEKWITPEYLRWYRQSPAREHRFAGVVDGEGRLSSFLMLAPAPVLGILNAWTVVDWFTTESSADELKGLLAAVAAEPEHVGLCESARTRPLLLRLTAMADDTVWAGVRGWWRAPVALNHLHMPPESLRLMPKRCVLSEGDLGL